MSYVENDLAVFVVDDDEVFVRLRSPVTGIHPLLKNVLANLLPIFFSPRVDRPGQHPHFGSCGLQVALLGFLAALQKAADHDAQRDAKAPTPNRTAPPAAATPACRASGPTTPATDRAILATHARGCRQILSVAVRRDAILRGHERLVVGNKGGGRNKARSANARSSGARAERFGSAPPGPAT